MLADFVAARDATSLEEILRGGKHAGRAIAALQGVPLLERRLQIGDFAGIRQSFDCLDLGAVALHRQHQAATHDFAIYAHGAGAADAVLTANVTACEGKTLAQEIDQRRASIHALLHALAVDGQRNVEGVVAHGRASSSCLATRRSNTPARCFFTLAVAWTSSFGSRSSAATAASILPLASAVSAFLTRTGALPTPK